MSNRYAIVAISFSLIIGMFWSVTIADLRNFPLKINFIVVFKYVISQVYQRSVQSFIQHRIVFHRVIYRSQSLWCVFFLFAPNVFQFIVNISVFWIKPQILYNFDKECGYLWNYIKRNANKAWMLNDEFESHLRNSHCSCFFFLQSSKWLCLDH